jgi:hypothetical protein
LHNNPNVYMPCTSQLRLIVARSFKKHAAS